MVLDTPDIVWISVGFAGQALFSLRFLAQWFQSEREKRSVIPESFWYFSLIGGIALLVYAIFRRDPVFILGQSTGALVYARNLHLIYLEQRRQRPQTPVSAATQGRVSACGS